MKVQAIGPHDADIMFVGEAPGAIEAKLGRPFVGPAGKLLTELMAAAGIVRSSCYITNAIKERPIVDAITKQRKKYIDLKPRTPTITAEYQTFEEELKQEIAQVKPNVVVAVGPIALWALCRLKGITKYRGSILSAHFNDKQKVIPIIHPAAAMRQYNWRFLIQHDLSRVRKEGTFPEVYEDDSVYILRPTFQEAMDYLNACEKSKANVAFDIECYGHQVSCISFSFEADSAISIVFYDGKDHIFNPEQEALIWRRIAQLLEDPDIPKLTQNGAFDTTFLFRIYGIQSKNCHDTMIAQSLIMPDHSKSLGFITSVYTKLRYYKDEGKETFNKGIKQNERFWLYNAKDSIVLKKAFPSQVRDLDMMDNSKTYDNQRRLLEPILYMTQRGIKVDTDGLVVASNASKKKVEELKLELNELVGREINPMSPKQLKEYFYVEKGIRPFVQQGKPTVNDNALKRLSIKGFKEAEIIRTIRKHNKLRGTYYEVVLDDDKRLRCSMNPVGTNFGRLSSSKTIFGTGGNMQNLPPSMKEFLLPDEGYVAYELDLSQAENRVVAWLGPEMKMIEAFQEGIDIHKMTASEIFKIPLKDVSTDEGSAGIRDFSHRDVGKRANHALNYGMGYRLGSLLWEVTEKQSKMICNGYHTAYPGVDQFHRRVREQLRKTRTLSNVFGRHFRFMDRWGDSLFKQAYSFIPQSTVADIINIRGLLVMSKGAKNEYKNAELLLQVHDSILFQMSTKLPWTAHANVLRSLANSLEQPLHINGLDLTIPCGAKMLANNFAHGCKFNLRDPDLAGLLEFTYADEKKLAS